MGGINLPIFSFKGHLLVKVRRRRIKSRQTSTYFA